MTIEQRIWEWMPARRARARVTSPVVVAANLDLPVDQVTAAMHGMLTRHELVADPRGGYHRGLPPQREGQGSCG